MATLPDLTQKYVALASIPLLLLATACSRNLGKSPTPNLAESSEIASPTDGQDVEPEPTKSLKKVASYKQAIDPAMGGYYDVVFSPDGRYVASRSFDEAIVWDIQKDIAALRVDLTAYGTNRIIFLPDSARIAIATGKTVSVINLQTGTETASFTLDKEVSQIDFSADGQKILAYAPTLEPNEGFIAVWDSQSGGKTTQIPYDQASSAAISPDGESIVTGGLDRTIRTWNSQTGQELTQINFNDGDSGNIPDRVGFVSDSSHIWALIDLHILRSWDIDSQEEILKVDDTGLLPEISDNGQLAAMIHVTSENSRTGEIGLWNTASGKELARLADEDCRFSNYFAFSTNNRYLATLCFKQAARERAPLTIFDLQTRTKISTPIVPTGNLSGFYLSADGQQIAIRSKSQDKATTTVDIWTTPTK